MFSKTKLSILLIVLFVGGVIAQPAVLAIDDLTKTSLEHTDADTASTDAPKMTRKEKRRAKKAAKETLKLEEEALLLATKEAEVAPVVPRTDTIKIPDALPHPDKAIEEFLVIKTRDLHGYSDDEVQLAAATTKAQAMSLVNQGVNMGAMAYGEYLIGEADILEFISFNDETLNRDNIVVRYDGQVSLPLIPDVRVGGLSRTAAEDMIRESYASVYREPEISLTVITPESKTYTVMGDVNLGGRFAYTRHTTLNEAISLAGGLRERNAGGSSSGGFIGLTGQITQAFVIRQVDGQRQVFDYDMRGQGRPGNHSGDVEITYGDVIYVPEGVNLVYLLGEGNAPLAVELMDGMTLLRMLSFSGGFNASTARLREVALLREVDDTNTEVQIINVRELLNKGGQDILLQPGDIIYIPQKHLVRSSEFVARFTGSISPLLDMYNTAIESLYTLDLNSSALDALNNNNNNVIVPRGGTINPVSIGR